QLTTSSPSLRYQSSGPVRTVEVKGNVNLEGNGARIHVFPVSTFSPPIEHNFIVWKDIFQQTSGANNGLQFYSFNGVTPNNQKINLILRGPGNHQFVNRAGSSPKLGNIK